MYADYQCGLSIAEVAAKWGVQQAAVYHRFKASGKALRPRGETRVGALYFDYCTGMSLDEVAAKGGTTRRVLYRLFSASQLPLRRRPRRVRQQPDPALRGLQLQEANKVRTQLAIDAHREVWEKAMLSTPSQRWRTVLAARLDNPDMSLSELALQLGVTKDAVASVLRRSRESVAA